MGQAKLRGTYDERAAISRQTARAKFPSSVQCNNCQADLMEIESMDVRGMPGMRLAGAARCESCTHTTWILDGTPEALSNFQDFMNRVHGEEAKVGAVVKPTS